MCFNSKGQIDIVFHRRIKMLQENLNKEQCITKDDSEAEKIVRDILKKIINPEQYSIKEKLSLSTVFNIEGEGLQEKYKSFCKIFFDVQPEENNNDLSKTHFDFVIAKKDRNGKSFDEDGKKVFRPVLIIEVNGGFHLTNPNKRYMDSFKLALSQSELIPLIKVPLYKWYENDEIEKMVTGTIQQINVKKAIPVYCSQCENKRLNIRYNSKTKNPFFYCPSCKNSADKNKSLTFDFNKISLNLFNKS